MILVRTGPSADRQGDTKTGKRSFAPLPWTSRLAGVRSELLFGDELYDHYAAWRLTVVPCRNSAGRMVLASPLEIGRARREGLCLALLPGDGNGSFEYISESRAFVHMERNLTAGFDDQHGRLHTPFPGRKLSQWDFLKHVHRVFRGSRLLRNSLPGAHYCYRSDKAYCCKHMDFRNQHCRPPSFGWCATADT